MDEKNESKEIQMHHGGKGIKMIKASNNMVMCLCDSGDVYGFGEGSSLKIDRKHPRTPPTTRGVQVDATRLQRNCVQVSLVDIYYYVVTPVWLYWCLCVRDLVCEDKREREITDEHNVM